MNNYKLLTPGPLTTTDSVKREMLFDRCTWDNDYKEITQKIRSELLKLAGVSAYRYTAVLMQGSGSFGVESVLTTAIGDNDKCLIIINGAYGERMYEMAKRLEINYETYEIEYSKVPVIEELRELLTVDKEITHVAMVHCETSTGILNPLEEVVTLAKEFGKIVIIDAMSSFGGIPIKVEELDIDYIISSANKCIQGVPGFSFVIAKLDKISECRNNARSLCLDLYDQWIGMNKDGKWRFTSPTHVVAAFSKALDELIEEGGIEARYERYKENNAILIKRMNELGFKTYIEQELQSPIITTFIFDKSRFTFEDFYYYVKERGYVIYPGKLTVADTFRIGNIGEIYKEDIEKLCNIIGDYINGK